MNEGLYNKRSISAFKKEHNAKSATIEETPKEGYLMLVAGEGIAWASNSLSEAYKAAEDKEAFFKNADDFEVADADYLNDDGDEVTSSIIYRKAKRNVLATF